MGNAKRIKPPGNAEYIELAKAIAAMHVDDCPVCLWARSLEARK